MFIRTPVPTCPLQLLSRRLAEAGPTRGTLTPAPDMVQPIDSFVLLQFTRWTNSFKGIPNTHLGAMTTMLRLMRATPLHCITSGHGNITPLFGSASACCIVVRSDVVILSVLELQHGVGQARTWLCGGQLWYQTGGIFRRQRWYIFSRIVNRGFWWRVNPGG